MRAMILVLGIFALTVALDTPTKAESYPWCAVYDMGDAAYSCSFVTGDQCWHSVRGTGGFCTPNNTYRPSVTTEYRLH
jgi:hypothetical protein